MRAKVGREGESGVSCECRKWLQMTKMAGEKKNMLEKHGQRESVRGAHKRLQLNWQEQESIQVFQLKHG